MMNQIKLYQNPQCAEFFSRIEEIMTHKEIILNDPKLFNFRIHHEANTFDSWVLHLQYRPKYLICLGQLIILWQSEPWFRSERMEYFPNGKKYPAKYRENVKGIYLYKHGGLALSGISSTWGWYADGQAVVHNPLPNNGDMLQSYLDVAKQYQYEADKTDLNSFEEFFNYFEQVKNTTA